MTISFIRRLLLFLVLCLAQALVLGRIQLFGCASPLLYVYFTIIFQRGHPRWSILLWSFALGLTVDMFSNTPGVAAASMTLIGFLQPYLIELFLPRDAEADIPSSAKSLGIGRFACLAGLLTLAYSLVFFALESFSFFNWLYWLQCSLGSALLTFLLIMTVESLRVKS